MRFWSVIHQAVTVQLDFSRDFFAIEHLQTVTLKIFDISTYNQFLFFSQICFQNTSVVIEVIV